MILALILKFNNVYYELDYHEYDYNNGVVTVATHIFKTGFEDEL